VLNKRWSVLALAIVSLGLAEGLYRAGWLDGWERWHYDLFHNVSGKMEEPQNVTIVSMDNETILSLKDEPMVFWGPHLARAVEIIREAGARLVGLDHLFAVSPEEWLKKLQGPWLEASRVFDAPLRRQLSMGSIVLIGLLAPRKGEEMEILLPVEDYLYSLPNGVDDVGIANFFSDSDGIVRRFVPFLPVGEGKYLASFGTLLALRAKAEALSHEAKDLMEQKTPLPIRFLGPPGTFKRVSMARLLAPNALEDEEVRGLKGKIVIVAAEHVGFQDLHLTPYAHSLLGREGGMMSGAELHANICETVLRGKYPREVPSAFRLLVGFIAVVLWGSLWMKADPWKGLVSVAIVMAFSSFVSFLLFRAELLLPSSFVHASMGVCFLGAMGLRVRREERERKRLEALFGRYVSKEALDRIMLSSKRPDLGGEAVEITVMFSDLRDFTTISELLEPHETVELLNGFLGRASEAVLEEGGMIDKYLGDGLMAVFGWPVPFGDHASRAVRAARRIVREVRAMEQWVRERFGSKGLGQLRVGIGLDTGVAVLGNVGSARRMDLTAVGDVVNTASRCEAATKELGWEIVATLETAISAGLNPLLCKEVQFKGKKSPTTVCCLEEEGEGRGQGR
jgi:adenylate cyclase